MSQNKSKQTINLKKSYRERPGCVEKVVKKYNIVMDKEELFKQRSCEYYLHFNIILPIQTCEELVYLQTVIKLMQIIWLNIQTIYTKKLLFLI